MNDLPRPILESYWVEPKRLLAGEYPGHYREEQTRQRLDIFLQAGFGTFINLTAKGELPPYWPILKEQARAYERSVSCLHFPIGDFGLPTREAMLDILNAIDSALAVNHKVYLHCQAGVGRTGTTVGCYLVRHGFSGERALQQLGEWWQTVPKSKMYPRSPENKSQEQFILNWKE